MGLRYFLDPWALHSSWVCGSLPRLSVTITMSSLGQDELRSSSWSGVSV
jgi:hypothetical protein